MKLNYFEHNVTFKQIVKLSGKTAIVKGYLNFMVCDASKCLPPSDVDFEFKLSAAEKEQLEEENVEEQKETSEALDSKAPQIFDPVSWNYETKNLGNNEYELVFKAEVEKGVAYLLTTIERRRPLTHRIYF